MKVLLALLFASACSLSTGENRSDVENQAESHSEGCKIEGNEIGQEAIYVGLGTKGVLVHDWIGKTGATGEYVGFSLTVDGGSTIHYVVKASGELHPSDGMTWIHPNGADGGSKSPGVSNVDFCDDCDNPDGCDGGGGGGDCDNPDGCDGGGGGGDGGGECDNPDGCGGSDGGPILT